ncbi:Putative expansin-B2 [Linum perenne]
MAAMNTLSPPMKPRHVFTYSLVVYFSFFKLSSSSRPINDGVVTHFNGSSAAELAQSQWSTAGATWYGGPDGDGSDGGACGYSTAVSQPPFSSMVTAVGPSLYNSGKECGACYQVKCNKNPSCSGNPVRVVITDSCPGGPCASESAHFDLSGTAFGAMALSGHESKLRDAGVLEVLYSRVPCHYSGKTVSFHVDSGSNADYFAVVVEFEAGDGDLATVDLAAPHKSDDQWEPMQQSWGAVWKLDSGNRLNPPFSIKLTSRFSGETLVAKNVIPAGWQAGATYRSLVNFN